MIQRKFPAVFLRGGTGKAITVDGYVTGLRVWAVAFGPAAVAAICARIEQRQTRE